MTETVRCAYCYEKFTGETHDEAMGARITHQDRAHQASQIAGRGEIEELAGLLRAAIDAQAQRVD
jgi:hypothetical protein